MLFERWIKSWRSAIAENFFLKALLLLLAVGFIANATFFKKHERIILVPPTLKEPTALDKENVPLHYLEQMGVFFATLAGNLSPSSAEYQASVLAQYSPSEHEVARELIGTASYIKKYNIYQSFYPETVNISGSNPFTIKVSGRVERRVSNTIISRERVEYIIEVSYNNYRVFLKSIYPDYPEREKRKQDVKEKKGVSDEMRLELKEQPFIPIEEKVQSMQEQKR